MIKEMTQDFFSDQSSSEIIWSQLHKILNFYEIKKTTEMQNCNQRRKHFSLTSRFEQFSKPKLVSSTVRTVVVKLRYSRTRSSNCCRLLQRVLHFNTKHLYFKLQFAAITYPMTVQAWLDQRTAKRNRPPNLFSVSSQLATTTNSPPQNSPPAKFTGFASRKLTIIFVLSASFISLNG